MWINTLADHHLFCAVNYQHAESVKPSEYKGQTKPSTQTMKTVNCMPAAVYMLTKLSILSISLYCLNFTNCWAYAGSPLDVQCKKTHKKNTV